MKLKGGNGPVQGRIFFFSGTSPNICSLHPLIAPPVQTNTLVQAQLKGDQTRKIIATGCSVFWRKSFL